MKGSLAPILDQPSIQDIVSSIRISSCSAKKPPPAGKEAVRSGCGFSCFTGVRRRGKGQKRHPYMGVAALSLRHGQLSNTHRVAVSALRGSARQRDTSIRAQGQSGEHVLQGFDRAYIQVVRRLVHDDGHAVVPSGPAPTGVSRTSAGAQVVLPPRRAPAAESSRGRHRRRQARRAPPAQSLHPQARRARARSQDSPISRGNVHHGLLGHSPQHFGKQRRLACTVRCGRGRCGRCCPRRAADGGARARRRASGTRPRIGRAPCARAGSAPRSKRTLVHLGDAQPRPRAALHARLFFPHPRREPPWSRRSRPEIDGPARSLARPSWSCRSRCRAERRAARTRRHPVSTIALRS